MCIETTTFYACPHVDIHLDPCDVILAAEEGIPCPVQKREKTKWKVCAHCWSVEEKRKRENKMEEKKVKKKGKKKKKTGKKAKKKKICVFM